MNFVQSEKMRYQDARQQLILSAKNLPRLLPCLDRWHRERRNMVLEARVSEVETVLARQRRPFRTLPAVDAWMEDCQNIRMRMPFLVLEGPTKLGKTQYCMSLAAPGKKGFEVNCSSAIEPDLREFDPHLHDLILFDEAHPKMIIHCKKLFQAPASWVGMASSGTNCHAYKVWVHGTKLIIGSNKWTAELAEMQEEDRKWIEDNQVFVKVDEALYLKDEGGAHRPSLDAAPIDREWSWA